MENLLITILRYQDGSKVHSIQRPNTVIDLRVGDEILLEQNLSTGDRHVRNGNYRVTDIKRRDGDNGLVFSYFLERISG